jgi:dTDP-4-amino-4,6-dideoxygalactose transaminase
VIFAYLYGIRYDISDYIAFLKDKNIDIIEDVAQSFIGPERFNGTPGARMTLFSLGMIKIQTCFYGGIAVIRDDVDLFNKMK